MVITKISINSLSNLDKIIDSSDNGTAFCYYYFLKLKNVKELLKVEENNKIVCLFPLFENGSKIEQSTMYVPYGGPVFFLKDYSYRKVILFQREIVRELIKYFQENYTEICFSCDTSMLDVKAFVNMGMVLEVRYTYIIDLRQKLKVIEGDFSKERKKDIRKAKRLGLELIYDDELKQFNLEKALEWERKYNNGTSKAFVEKYLKESTQKKLGKVFIAKNNSEIMGGVAIVWDINTAYIMYSYYEHNFDVAAIPFLYNEIIKYLKQETSCKYLDFEGSVFEEIEKWNLSFGAKQTLYFNYYWQKNNKEELFTQLYDYGEK